MKDNILIAEFMEIEQFVNQNKLEYHNSWDWLMPVVEKIESIGYEFTIVESRCKVSNNTDHSIKELFYIEKIGIKIDNVYDAVIQFIKQYNKIQ